MLQKIEYSHTFTKNYKKRISPKHNLVKKFFDRLALFQHNSTSPLLKDHALSGNKEGCRAFAITGDYRVVYVVLDSNSIIFLDIGTHNQVY